MASSTRPVHAPPPSFLARAKAHWRWFESLPPGQRFQKEHDRHERATQGRSPLIKAIYPLLAILALAIGVVLAFIPGPAFVFFGLAGALMAMQSRTVAGWLDRGEVWARARVARFKAWRARKRHTLA